MFKVGLTGNIGTGKSTVSDIFKQHSIEIIDADVIAKQISVPGTEIFEQIILRYGKSIIKNGGLDRKKIRQIIFSKENEKLWLEDLLHPIIIQKMQEQANNSNSPYCILVIPLLMEQRLFHLVDYVILVTSEPSLQQERLLMRDEISNIDLKRILSAQTPFAKARKHADDIIFNNQDIKYLESAVHDINHNILKILKR